MALNFKWLQRRRKKQEEERSHDPVKALRTMQKKMESSEALSDYEQKYPNQQGRTKFNSPMVNEERRFEWLNPLERIQSSLENRQAMDQNKHDEALRAILGKIAVVAFIGSSGTGKSTQAISVARRNKIEYIIDDGLLINGSRIIAGSSAKKARTKIESVRQALFMDATKAQNMRRALAEQQPAALMILGTSDSMLKRICEALWLNPPAMLIRIEDVTSEEQRQLAKTTRINEGQHTIPVPSMEIKHEFSGYFADPLGRLRRRFDRDRGIVPLPEENERTMVRPTFSSLGSYSMSDEALSHMIALICAKVPGVAEVLNTTIQKEVYGVIISLELTLYFGFNAQEVLQRTQLLVSKQAEEYTSINILAVNVRASRLLQGKGKKNHELNLIQAPQAIKS